MNVKTLVMTLVALALALPALGADDKEGVAVSVYNGGYGVVREVRKVDVGADGRVKFTDVPSAIDATTVHFRSLTDPDAKLLEQDYQYDLVSADKLLKKYIDQPIDVIIEGKTYTGTLLSFDDNQLILKDDAGLTMVQRPQNVRDIRFKELPEGLITRPTLLWLVSTQKPGAQLAEVTYQTGAMNWHAEYVMVLAPGDAAADLSGWVSVQNDSGKTYKDAKLKFIAGDVHRVQAPMGIQDKTNFLIAGAAREAAPMEEKPFFEYHMYTLPRPSTVADNEVKQLEMFTPVHDLKVVKRFVYNPMGQYHYWDYGGLYNERGHGQTDEKKIQVLIEFRNDEKNNLGIPLPAGKVRVYKRDDDDQALEFVGEEQIDHTPKDENLSLELGNAFDIVGEQKQTDFNVDNERHWMQESIEVKLRNHKKEDVVVRVKEPLFRWVNWKITHSSQEYVKLDARTVAFDVPVKADGEAVVTYTVEYTW